MQPDLSNPLAREWFVESLSRGAAARTEFAVAAASGALIYLCSLVSTGRFFSLTDMALSAIALGTTMAIRALIIPAHTRKSIFAFYGACFVIALFYAIVASKT